MEEIKRRAIMFVRKIQNHIPKLMSKGGVKTLFLMTWGEEKNIIK